MLLNNGNKIITSIETNLTYNGRNLKSLQLPFNSTPYRGLLSKTTSSAGRYLLLSMINGIKLVAFGSIQAKRINHIDDVFSKSLRSFGNFSKKLLGKYL